MRSVVVLPAPSGPTSPKISPARDRQVQMVHRRQLAEAPGEAAGFDDGFHHCPSRISASAGMFDFSSRPGFSTSILMRYTSFTRSCCGLDLLGRELRLRGDERDAAVVTLPGIRIRGHARLRAELHRPRSVSLM